MFKYEVTQGQLGNDVTTALEVLNDELVTFEDASEILGIIPQYTRRTLNENATITRVTIAGKVFFLREEIVGLADDRVQRKADRSSAAEAKRNEKASTKAANAETREKRAATKKAAKLLDEAAYDADDETAAAAVDARERNRNRKSKGGTGKASFGDDVDAAIADILAEDEPEPVQA